MRGGLVGFVGSGRGLSGALARAEAVETQSAPHAWSHCDCLLIEQAVDRNENADLNPRSAGGVPRELGTPALRSPTGLEGARASGRTASRNGAPTPPGTSAQWLHTTAPHSVSRLQYMKALL